MSGEDEIRRLRLRSQRLAPRECGGAAEAVRAVCGVQAQDAAAARLAVRARAEAVTAADVDAAGLVRTWAWRGTLHLLAREDLAWVLPLVAPVANRAVRARWRALGLDEATYERARGVIAEAARPRAELRDRLAAAGVDASGQRLPHLVRRVALEGLVELRLDDTIAPLEPPPTVTHAEALATLAPRYLAAYGPAGPRDLAAWSGLPAADVKAAWAAVDGAPAPGEPVAPASVRLLGGFDTYLLGYRTRDSAVAPEHARRVWPGGGWLHPVLLVDGRAAGTWRLARAPGRVTVTVQPFAALSPPVRDATRREAEDVGRFLGLRARLEVAPA